MSRKFVKVPKIWLEYLVKADADTSTYRVAMYLLDQAAWGNIDVPLGSRVLEKHGVSRWGKWRALQKLRQIGLVAVENRRGRPPLVRVRFTR
jgi:hypothetical protein